MKTNLIQTFLLAAALLALPAATQAQFNYTVNPGNTNVTITGYTGPGGAVTIPSTINVGGNNLPVVGIGDDAFAERYSLTSVSIPGSVTSIGDEAFYGCSGLTSITIPNSVTNIGDYAFFECIGLTNVTIGNGVTSIGYNAFNSCTGLISVTIPNSVTSIGDYAFADCGLTSVTIPDSVTTIGDGAFYNCTSLTSMTMPDSVTNIGASAFAYCHYLTSVMIGNGVTSIGDWAFYDCESLTNVAIGNGVTSIGNGAFGGYASYSQLRSVYFTGNAPSNIGADVFTVCVPMGGGCISDPATIYYLPNTSGWSNTFAGRPTALWLPQVLTGDGNFGVRTNQFGFNIAWASGQTVVVEAATNLSNPIWTPVTTNTLASDSVYFSDPQWANFPQRFYRLTMP